MRTLTSRHLFPCALPFVPILYVVCICMACSDSNPRLECSTASIIYGNDDRREVWETRPQWQDLATNFVVAVADKWTVERLTAQQLTVYDLAARDTISVCADERFADQPSLAVCSGVMLAPDLLLTAGHCVDGTDDCGSLVYMTRFANQRDAAWDGVQQGSIRRCRSIARIDSVNDPSGTALDVALVRLDSAFDVPHTWFPIRADAPRVGERVIAMGHPLGLPLKLDEGGKVLSKPHVDDGYVTADVDAFRGSSGGPVFDAAGALLGLVLGGMLDHTYEREGDCLRVKRIGRANGGHAERVAPVAEALAALCRSGSELACEFKRSAAAVAPEQPIGCEVADRSMGSGQP